MNWITYTSYINSTTILHINLKNVTIFSSLNSQILFLELKMDIFFSEDFEFDKLIFIKSCYSLDTRIQKNKIIKIIMLRFLRMCRNIFKSGK